LLDTRGIILYIIGVNINGQIFSPDIICKIQATIDEQPAISRRKLSRDVCEWLDWRAPKGDLKEMSCRVALLRLHREGHIHLPPAAQKPVRKSHKSNLSEIEKELNKVECSLKDLGSVEIIPIKGNNRKHSAIWNHLFDRYHYLGSGPLVGAQMRYLIRSAHYGWLGGLSFSAAAWQLRARDEWIGWESSARKKNLNLVIGNSRFLILPQVKVANLASHVLSLCIRHLPEDWQNRYGVRPVLLETFVEKERFTGSSYRAANWQYIGTTKGRGRQDKSHEFALAVKDIYIYPLCKKAREILCEGPPKPVRGAIENSDWAGEELGCCELGDKRKVKRLLTIARDFYARPQANIPQACNSRAKTKAAYRFFEDKSNTMNKIFKSHYEAALGRIHKEKVVLAVQDTTTLNYSTHPATADLGLIASRQEGIIGLIVHDTMAFNPKGTPLGLIDVQSWARDPADFGKKHLRAKLSIEQKESNKWLKSYQAVAETQKRCPNTTLISVGDREADIYELFHLAKSKPDGPKLLIRGEHNRMLVDGQGHLWDYISEQPLAGIQEIHVPRKGIIKPRQAKLEVRFASVKLKPPTGKEDLGELSIQGIIAREIDAPAEVSPLQWMLLTTCEIQTFEQAVEKLDWYCQRWGIEIYHRTLKSGCKIENRQLGSADRIETCLAVDMVVAWRIYHLTKLGREKPDAPCTIFFEDHEWKALMCYETKNPIPPEKPPTLREATRMVAALGGFLGRKCDGEPGTVTLWLGLQRLDDMTAMWKIAMSYFAPELVKSPSLVSSPPRYG
jgi:hypothetical protein